MINGIHNFIKKHHVKFKEFDNLKEFVESHAPQTVYFDLFGCLFSFIRKEIAAGREQALYYHLTELLKIPNLKVVLDGSRSMQKYETSLK